VASTPGVGSDLAPAAYKYKYKQGYLDAGNDIDKAAVQSLAEAQTVCDGMLQCVGFTFQDAPFTTTVEQVTERNKESNKESNDGGAAPLELSDLDADTIAAGSEGSAASPLARKIYFKQSGVFTSNTAGWHAFVKDGKTGAAGVATDAAGVAAEEVAQVQRCGVRRYQWRGRAYSLLRWGCTRKRWSTGRERRRMAPWAEAHSGSMRRVLKVFFVCRLFLFVFGSTEAQARTCRWA
jgi:hypothetical protein